MADVNLTAQLNITAPSQSQLSAAKRKIQTSLNNVNANIQLKGSTATLTSLKQINRQTRDVTTQTQLMGRAVGDAARRFASYTSAAVIVGRFAQQLSRATSDAIKFEREFIKISQVFDKTVPQLSSLKGEISSLAREFGLSANVITKTSVVLAQSGLTAKETEKALRSLTKTTLASTFNNISQTAEGAVAILAQF